MSKLFRLKKWMNLPEAAARLSATFGEEVHESDIYRLALDGHLVLSVLFVNKAIARSCRIVTPEEIDWMDIPSLDGVKVVRIPANGRILRLNEGLYLIENGLLLVEGVWDLPLLGGERLDVEFAYQQLTGGPEVAGVSLEGVFVKSQDGAMFEIQDRMKAVPKARNRKRIGGWFSGLGQASTASADSKKWLNLDDGADTHPAGALPEDCLFVIRTEALLQFEQSMLEDSLSQGRPLQTKERFSLLTIIAALAKEAKIDVAHPSKAASLIEGMTTQMGAPVAKRTIEEHLKRIPSAIDARAK